MGNLMLNVGFNRIGLNGLIYALCQLEHNEHLNDLERYWMHITSTTEHQAIMEPPNDLFLSGIESIAHSFNSFEYDGFQIWLGYACCFSKTKGWYDVWHTSYLLQLAVPNNQTRLICVHGPVNEDLAKEYNNTFSNTTRKWYRSHLTFGSFLDNNILKKSWTYAWQQKSSSRNFVQEVKWLWFNFQGQGMACDSGPNKI